MRWAASVGCVLSQKRWLLLLVQYVANGRQGASALSFPRPQQAALTSANPEFHITILMALVTLFFTLLTLISLWKSDVTIGCWFLNEVLHNAVTIKVGVVYASELRCQTLQHGHKSLIVLNWQSIYIFIAFSISLLIPFRWCASNNPNPNNRKFACTIIV